MTKLVSLNNQKSQQQLPSPAIEDDNKEPLGPHYPIINALKKRYFIPYVSGNFVHPDSLFRKPLPPLTPVSIGKILNILGQPMTISFKSNPALSIQLPIWELLSFFKVTNCPLPKIELYGGAAQAVLGRSYFESAVDFPSLDVQHSMINSPEHKGHDIDIRLFYDRSTSSEVRRKIADLAIGKLVTLFQDKYPGEKFTPQILQSEILNNQLDVEDPHNAFCVLTFKGEPHNLDLLIVTHLERYALSSHEVRIDITIGIDAAMGSKNPSKAISKSLEGIRPCDSNLLPTLTAVCQVGRLIYILNPETVNPNGFSRIVRLLTIGFTSIQPEISVLIPEKSISVEPLIKTKDKLNNPQEKIAFAINAVARVLSRTKEIHVEEIFNKLLPDSLQFDAKSFYGLAANAVKNHKILPPVVLAAMQIAGVLFLAKTNTCLKDPVSVEQTVFGAANAIRIGMQGTYVTIDLNFNEAMDHLYTFWKESHDAAASKILSEIVHALEHHLPLSHPQEKELSYLGGLPQLLPEHISRFLTIPSYFAAKFAVTLHFFVPQDEKNKIVLSALFPIVFYAEPQPKTRSSLRQSFLKSKGLEFFDKQYDDTTGNKNQIEGVRNIYLKEIVPCKGYLGKMVALTTHLGVQAQVCMNYLTVHGLDDAIYTFGETAQKTAASPEDKAAVLNLLTCCMRMQPNDQLHPWVKNTLLENIEAYLTEKYPSKALEAFFQAFKESPLSTNESFQEAAIIEALCHQLPSRTLNPEDVVTLQKVFIERLNHIATNQDLETVYIELEKLKQKISPKFLVKTQLQKKFQEIQPLFARMDQQKKKVSDKVEFYRRCFNDETLRSHAPHAIASAMQLTQTISHKDQEALSKLLLEYVGDLSKLDTQLNETVDRIIQLRKGCSKQFFAQMDLYSILLKQLEEQNLTRQALPSLSKLSHEMLNNDQQSKLIQLIAKTLEAYKQESLSEPWSIVLDQVNRWSQLADSKLHSVFEKNFNPMEEIFQKTGKEQARAMIYISTKQEVAGEHILPALQKLEEQLKTYPIDTTIFEFMTTICAKPNVKEVLAQEPELAQQINEKLLLAALRLNPSASTLRFLDQIKGEQNAYIAALLQKDPSGKRAYDFAMLLHANNLLEASCDKIIETRLNKKPELAEFYSYIKLFHLLREPLKETILTHLMKQSDENCKRFAIDSMLKHKVLQKELFLKAAHILASLKPNKESGIFLGMIDLMESKPLISQLSPEEKIKAVHQFRLHAKNEQDALRLGSFMGSNVFDQLLIKNPALKTLRPTVEELLFTYQGLMNQIKWTSNHVTNARKTLQMIGQFSVNEAPSDLEGRIINTLLSAGDVDEAYAFVVTESTSFQPSHFKRLLKTQKLTIKQVEDLYHLFIGIGPKTDIELLPHFASYPASELKKKVIDKFYKSSFEGTVDSKEIKECYRLLFEALKDQEIFLGSLFNPEGLKKWTAHFSPDEINDFRVSAVRELYTTPPDLLTSESIEKAVQNLSAYLSWIAPDHTRFLKEAPSIFSRFFVNIATEKACNTLYLELQKMIERLFPSKETIQSQLFFHLQMVMLESGKHFDKIDEQVRLWRNISIRLLAGRPSDPLVLFAWIQHVDSFCLEMREAFPLSPDFIKWHNETVVKFHSVLKELNNFSKNIDPERELKYQLFCKTDPKTLLALAQKVYQKHQKNKPAFIKPILDIMVSEIAIDGDLSSPSNVIIAGFECLLPYVNSKELLEIVKALVDQVVFLHKRQNKSLNTDFLTTSAIWPSVLESKVTTYPQLKEVKVAELLPR